MRGQLRNVKSNFAVGADIHYGAWPVTSGLAPRAFTTSIGKAPSIPRRSGGPDARLLHAALRYRGVKQQFLSAALCLGLFGVARRNSGELRHCCKGQPLSPPNKKLKAPEHALDNLLPRGVHLGKKLGQCCSSFHPVTSKPRAPAKSSCDSAPGDSLRV